jgi:hypothetical protein
MKRRYRSTWNQQITERQMEIIRGSLLGDGTMWKTRNENQVSYFSATSVIKDYAEWKYTELQNLCTRPVLVRERERKGTKTVAYEVNTASHPIFHGLRHIWYPEGKKIVPEDVAIWLTPLTLAVWYMDDGYRFSDTIHKMKGYLKLYVGRSITFSTDGFSIEDKRRLASALYKRYGVSIHLVDNRKHIRFNRLDSLKLVLAMKPYIHPSFNYKIKIDAPNETLPDKTEPSLVDSQR